jgi:hypothetical protein
MISAKVNQKSNSDIKNKGSILKSRIIKQNFQKVKIFLKYKSLK